MDKNRKPLTKRERVRIYQAHLAGANIHGIMDKFHRSFATVKKIITAPPAGVTFTTPPTENQKKIVAANRALSKPSPDVISESIFLAFAKQLSATYPEVQRVVIDLSSGEARLYVTREIRISIK